MVSSTKDLSVGIIGRGHFGGLLKKLLSTDFKTVVMIGSDATLDQRHKVYTSDIVINAVNLDAYDAVLNDLKDQLPPDSLLFDVASVKVKPAKLIKKYVPKHKNLLLTHPLFGPQSITKGTDGLKLIVCEESGGIAEFFLNYLKNTFKFDVIRMTANEHDKAMAYTQGLTFFISEALQYLKLNGDGIATPSYNKLLEISKVAENESKHLLNSVQNNNPYSKEVRESFLKQVGILQKEYTD